MFSQGQYRYAWSQNDLCLASQTGFTLYFPGNSPHAPSCWEVNESSFLSALSAGTPYDSKGMLKAALELSKLLQDGTVFKLRDISEIHVDKGYGYTLFTAQGGVPLAAEASHLRSTDVSRTQ